MGIPTPQSFAVGKRLFRFLLTCALDGALVLLIPPLRIDALPDAHLFPHPASADGDVDSRALRAVFAPFRPSDANHRIFLWTTP